MSREHLLALFCAALAFAFSPAADADTDADPASSPAPGMQAATPAPDAPHSPFGAVKAVEGSALQAVSGMANLQQFANAENNSVVAGNSVNGQSVTGQIAIDGQSFQNMNGLSILTANTGNNVSINAAMNVNVSIQQ